MGTDTSKQDTSAIHNALREILERNLGETMDTDDLVELLPADITEQYSDDDLYDIVDDYHTEGCQEDGFIIHYDAFLENVVFKIPAKDYPFNLNDVTRVDFSIGGFISGMSSLEIVREPAGIFLRAQHGVEYEEPETETAILSENEFGKIVDVLKMIEILDWSDDYFAPVMDGTQWDLLLEFPEHVAFSCGGSNAYPRGFNALLKTMIDLGLQEEFYDYEAETMWEDLIPTHTS